MNDTSGADPPEPAQPDRGNTPIPPKYTALEYLDGCMFIIGLTTLFGYVPGVLGVVLTSVGEPAIGIPLLALAVIQGIYFLMMLKQALKKQGGRKPNGPDHSP